jgi:hypothetical protein
MIEQSVPESVVVYLWWREYLRLANVFKKHHVVRRFEDPLARVIPLQWW